MNAHYFIFMLLILILFSHLCSDCEHQSFLVSLQHFPFYHLFYLRIHKDKRSLQRDSRPSQRSSWKSYPVSAIFSFIHKSFSASIWTSSVFTLHGHFPSQIVPFIHSWVIHTKSTGCSQSLWVAGFINISHMSTVRYMDSINAYMYKLPLCVYNNRIELYLYICTGSRLSLRLCTHSPTHRE